MRRDAVIIEVGLNEAAPRALNRYVPYSPEECAEDARRCAAAGAAVVHWHARDPLTGEQLLGDARIYGEALDHMRDVDVLAYPSYPVDTTAFHERFGHLWTLHDRHGLELAPLDVGSVNTVLWDEQARSFVATDQLLDGAVVTNPLPLTLQALDEIYARNMQPTVTSFDVGITRTVVLLTQAGKLRPPVFLKIFLSGAWAVGPFPTEEGLDFHLRQIPENLDIEWVLVPYALSDPALIERLCRHALARGGGIRVGIGDTPGAYPRHTNAQLVEDAARWAEEAGRPVASAADVRRRFGLRRRWNDR
ncbi:MAG TPA: 3-keto-5-aminohexanoate cleavage protein [Candidatus Margulisiibacteriota bacterium]|nr:3-keto-5-aminohexanoate cleavage protein [Candidatus Margulisiibacteriota bacterium]